LDCLTNTMILKMKTEDVIDKVIEKEKQVESNPFLSTRIMSKIVTENAPLNKRVYFFRLARGGCKYCTRDENGCFDRENLRTNIELTEWL